MEAMEESSVSATSNMQAANGEADVPKLREASAEEMFDGIALTNRSQSLAEVPSLHSGRASESKKRKRSRKPRRQGSAVEALNRTDDSASADTEPLDSLEDLVNISPELMQEIRDNVTLLPEKGNGPRVRFLSWQVFIAQSPSDDKIRCKICHQNFDPKAFSPSRIRRHLLGHETFFVKVIQCAPEREVQSANEESTMERQPTNGEQQLEVGQTNDHSNGHLGATSLEEGSTIDWQQHVKQCENDEQVSCKWCADLFTKGESMSGCIIDHLQVKHGIKAPIPQLANGCPDLVNVTERPDFTSCPLCAELVISPEMPCETTTTFRAHMLEKHLNEPGKADAFRRLLALLDQQQQPAPTRPTNWDALHMFPFNKCINCRVNFTTSSCMLPCFHFVCPKCFDDDLWKNTKVKCTDCGRGYGRESVVTIWLNNGNVVIGRRCVTCDTMASWFCHECSDSLCQRCAEAHKFVKQTLKHEVTPKRRDDTLSLQDTCDAHQRSALHYCMSCSEVLCKQCLNDGHEGHQLEDYEATKKQIEATANGLMDKVISVRQILLEAREQLEKMGKSWQNHQALCIQTQKEIFDDIRLLLRSQDCLMEGKLKEKFDEVSKRLMANRQRCVVLKNWAEQLVSVVNFIHSLSDPDALIRGKEFLEEMLHTMTYCVISNVPNITPVEMNLDITSFKNIARRMGKIVDSVTQ